MQKEPLFENYLFANISEAEAPLILSMNNVINFVYWKQDPIVVAEEDILIIKNLQQTIVISR